MPDQGEPRWQFGHSGPVRAAGFSPDGQRIVAGGSGGGGLRIWDAASGALLQTFEGHSGSVGAAGFSPDGQRIVSGSDDGSVRIWDAARGEAPRGRLDRASSSKGSLSDDTASGTLESASGQEAALFSLGGPVQSIEFSPVANRILTGGTDARVIDLDTGRTVLRLATTRAGWISQIDGDQYRWGGDGARLLRFKDADDHELIPTLWHAEDLLGAQDNAPLLTSESTESEIS